MKFINNLSIGKRLYFVFGTILFLTFGNLIYNLISLGASKQSVVGINSSLLSIDYLIEADRDAYQSKIAISEALHTDSTTKAENLTHLIEEILENKDQVKERYTKFSNSFNVKSNDEIALIDERFWNNFNSLSSVTDSIVFYLKNKDLQSAKRLYVAEYNNYFSPMRETLNSFTEIHLKESDNSFNTNLDLNYSIRVNSIVIFVLIILIFLFSGLTLAKSITKPLFNLKEVIADLSIGKLPETTIEGKDEIAQMGSYVVKLTDSLKKTANFAQEIGNGNLDAGFDPSSNDDVLGHSLVQMKNNLAKFAKEDEQRNWLNNGVASLGDILRNNNLSANELYFNTLSFIVKYLKANQGGLFVLNNEDANNVKIELVSSYAYERKKYIEKEIAIGEGLVGQAVIEKDIIYMTDVPNNYTKITSGIGEACPRNILIVPLKNNEEVYGVIEIASFQILKEYEIEFVRRIGESIASTISTVKVNETTKKLLEHSQQMTEELRAQEEEMRQNMEELAATQEDTHRNMMELNEMKKELQIRENIFGLTTILSEADKYGNIIMVNDKLCEISKYSRNELIGKPHNIFRHPDMPKELFKIFWETIKAGNVFKGIILNKAKDGTHYWVDATIVPIKDDKGEIIKYVGARYHITEDYVAEELYNKQAKKFGFSEYVKN